MHFFVLLPHSIKSKCSFYLIRYLFKEGINKDPPFTGTEGKYQKVVSNRFFQSCISDKPSPRILLKGKSWLAINFSFFLYNLYLDREFLLLRILRIIPNGGERKFKNSLLNDWIIEIPVYGIESGSYTGEYVWGTIGDPWKKLVG